jgi:hypothetical protein
MIAPAGVVVGLALFFFPSSRRERTERGENVSHLSDYDYELVTRRWWIINGIAIGCGSINYAILESL